MDPETSTQLIRVEIAASLSGGSRSRTVPLVAVSTTLEVAR